MGGINSAMPLCAVPPRARPPCSMALPLLADHAASASTSSGSGTARPRALTAPTEQQDMGGNPSARRATDPDGGAVHPTYGAAVHVVAAGLTSALALGLASRHSTNWHLRRRWRRGRHECAGQREASSLLRRAERLEPTMPEIDLTPTVFARVPPMVRPNTFKASYGGDEPERTRASMVIQNRLVTESQYQAVLALVEKYLPMFDIVNLTCAMHMCAITVRDHELLTRQIQSDPNFVKLFHTVKAAILGDVKKVSPRTAADILWSCARLNIFDSELFSAIVADATTRLEYFSAHGISLIVFALGFIGQRPRASFMQALVRELRARIATEFEPQTIGMIVYGMMRLGIRDDRLMKIVSEQLQRSGLDDFEDLTVSCLAFAYAKLEYWDDKTFALLGKRMVATLPELSPRQVVMCSMCFAQSVAVLEESGSTMKRIEAAMLDRLDEFDNRSLATFCFAVGKFRQLTEVLDFEGRRPKVRGPSLDPLAIAFQKQVDKRGIGTFNMAEANLIVYSLMRMKHRDEALLATMALQLARSAPELQTVEIVNVLYAFARLDFLHIELVNAMVGEIKRRDLIRSSDTTHESIAAIAYSLGLLHVKEDEVMDTVAAALCERVREFSSQSMSMILWGMAVTNCRNNAEPLISTCLEDMASRVDQFPPMTASIILWASALLTGPASAIWMLQVFFHPNFWAQNFEKPALAMIYHALAGLQAEAGLNVQDMQGWSSCRACYEELSGQSVGQQNQRLSDRLRMQNMQHQASAMVPARGVREAGMRVDIVIESLNLVIEVEGPTRFCIPLDKLMEKLATPGDAAASEPRKYGRPDEVLQDSRSVIECSLSGAAAFKRRLLRKCGWRVATVSFDDNEEYIADALDRMVKKNQTAGDNDATTQTGPSPAADRGPDAGTKAVPDLDSRIADFALPDLTFTGEAVQVEELELSQAELQMRKRHREALKELRRRITQERGDAAASLAYANHMEYRKWQVGIERQVFREMLATL